VQWQHHLIIQINNMSKASLIVGNSNWAIKDSSLLGYNINDSNIYSPFPFDVTRATPATTVNKAGLIVTDTEILSGELITNGSFATDSNWNLPSNLTITNGVAVANGVTSGQQLWQSFSSIGTYKVEFTISNFVSGGCKPIFHGGTFTGSSQVSSNGTFVQYITVTSTPSRFSIQFIGLSSVMTIDNISVIEVNQNNLARIDYSDSTKGVLLTEPLSTNLLTYSQNYNNTYWSKQNGNMLDGGIGLFYLSPLSNVIKYEATTVGYNQMSNRLSSVVTIDTTYTQQGYVKCDNAPYIHFQIHPLTGNPSVVWDNVNKVVISSPASIDNVNIKSLNDGWIKAEITYTATVASQYASIKTYFSTSPTINNSGVPIGTIAFQTFVQVEQKSFATSYIPTSSSTVTRNQDLVTNGGEVSTFNSEEGVLFAEMAGLSNGDDDDRFISLSDGTTDNQISIYLNILSGKISGLVSSNNVDAYLNSTGHNQLDFNKIALSYKGNDINLWVNGVKAQTVTTQNAPIGLSVLKLIAAVGSNKAFYGKTKNIQVFKKALTDGELLKLTTI